MMFHVVQVSKVLCGSAVEVVCDVIRLVYV